MKICSTVKYGGIDLLKLKKVFSCLLAVTTLLGGSAMAAAAVNENESNEKVYAHELDKQAYDGNDLGAVYKKDKTTFKVWAPSAQRVMLKLYATGSPDEEGAADISTTTMEKGNNGVWSTTLKGDKKNLYYTYLITVDGVTTETADVYSKAVGVNGNRSMIVDLSSTNPEGWDKDKHILYNDQSDAIVWEVHVRDFSKSDISGVSLKHKGKYLAFTEKGTTVAGQGEIPTCIDYLKKLGVTHVQLLPVYDYATVDESKENPEEYNWGYDPKNYNVPEGSYSTNPFDGNVRIKEFKQMIKALHDAGIGVIMDVVYNHTYTAKGSVFENTVPGYYYRKKADGTLSDGSGCGNETASEHLMYRKFMIDSVLYWANEYHIDGFRFDLMGVHDVKTMNMIRDALDKKVKDGKKIIMYGEPWTGGDIGTEEKTCVKANIKELNARVGAFNDDFRDAVKGHVFNAAEAGFVQTGEGGQNLRNCIAANCLGGGAWIRQPSQAVTYVSAHDNYTLYDKLLLSTGNEDKFDKRVDNIVEMNKLAAAITLTSQGINFMQAGEEFARTKFGDENSFISSDKINQLDWSNLITYADLNSYYQGLIEIRKNYKPFRDPSKKSAERIAFSESGKGVVAYTLENTLTKDKQWSYVAVAFNATDEEKEVTFVQSGDTPLPAKWEIVADAYEAGLKSLGTVEGSKVKIPAHSAMILADKASFDKLALSSDICTVTVEHKDESSGDIIKKQVLKGREGEGYTTAKAEGIEVEYDFDGVDGKEKGKFTKEDQTVTYKYNKFNGRIVELKVNYLQEADALLGSGNKEVSPSYVIKLRSGTEYNAPIRSIDGLKIRMDKFPLNAAGKAGDADIMVDYYYENTGSVDLVIHYYDTVGRDKMMADVFRETEDGKEQLTGKAPGTAMTADKELGDNWYTLTLEGKGAIDGLKVKFNDSKGKNPDMTIYDAKGEMWIERGVVTVKGEVDVIYVGDDGNIIETRQLTGREGKVYKTEQLSYENMKLAGVTDNTEGVFGKVPVYVIYSYDKLNITEKPVMPVIILLCASSFVTLAAAAVLGAVYSKKKKKYR